VVVEAAGDTQVVAGPEGEPGEVLRADDVDVEGFGSGVVSGDGEAEATAGWSRPGRRRGSVATVPVRVMWFTACPSLRVG
jgi:hypothetical protein